MRTSIDASAGDGDLGRLSDELDAVLARLVEGYRGLLGLLGEQREAIRRGDPGRIAAASGRQAMHLQLLADAEEQRRGVVQRWLERVSLPRLGRPVTLSDLAAHAVGDRRAELLARAEELRGLLREVASRGGVVRSAAASLVSHMEGLVRLVGQRASHAGTYSRRGCVEGGGGVVSALDLRS